LLNALVNLASQQVSLLNLLNDNYSKAGRPLMSAYLMDKLITIKKLFKCFMTVVYQI